MPRWRRQNTNGQAVPQPKVHASYWKMAVSTTDRQAAADTDLTVDITSSQVTLRAEVLNPQRELCCQTCTYAMRWTETGWTTTSHYPQRASDTFDQRQTR